ncbi:MAG: hypothetical protein ACLP0H_10835 [Terriglobales bacterium]
MNLPRSIPSVRSISVVLVIVTLFLPAALLHASETASCTFNTFSAPSGYSLNQVGGVSDDGTVVGQLVDNKTFESVGFMYSASGVFTEYAVPKSASTWLYGRNGSGANAGTYQDTAYPQHMHGFLLQSGQLSAINYPKAPNTWLFDANQIGGVVGSYTVNPSLMKGFMLMNSKYTSLAYPKAQATYPFAVNDNGAIVGSAPIGLVSNGFLWQNGKFTTINYPNSRYGTALQGINNSGVIVGNHLSSDRYFGFVYENGVFKNIVYSGANYTVTGGINNNGLISGQIFYKGGKTLGYTAVCK